MKLEEPTHPSHTIAPYHQPKQLLTFIHRKTNFSNILDTANVISLNNQSRIKNIFPENSGLLKKQIVLFTMGPTPLEIAIKSTLMIFCKGQ